jgi:hypothetical protein
LGLEWNRAGLLPRIAFLEQVGCEGADVGAEIDPERRIDHSADAGSEKKLESPSADPNSGTRTE